MTLRTYIQSEQRKGFIVPYIAGIIFGWSAAANLVWYWKLLGFILSVGIILMYIYKKKGKEVKEEIKEVIKDENKNI